MTASLTPTQVLTAWKDLNLTNMQRNLDEEGLVVVEQQQASLKSRKLLSESTKEWKKLGEAEQLSGIKALLKGYQQEIDANTKRCKVAEGYFLNMYKVLNSIPDPTPLLDQYLLGTERLKSLDVLEADLKKSKNESQELKDKLGGLRRVEQDLEENKGRIGDFEDKMEALVAERLMVKEEEWRLEFENKAEIFKERYLRY